MFGDLPVSNSAFFAVGIKLCQNDNRRGWSNHEIPQTIKAKRSLPMRWNRLSNLGWLPFLARS